MSIVSNSIRIKGGQGDFPFEVESIFLSQSFSEHHTFEVQAFIPQDEKCSLDTLRQVLGEYLEISFVSVEQPELKNTFLGFTDCVTPCWEGSRQRLKISGYSPTMLMDGGPAFRTFSEQGARAIFDKITASYSGTYFPEIKVSAAAGKVFYAVQNQETDYRYLCRLADSCEELFWYDGTKLHFGKLHGASICLKNGEDLEHLEASVNLCPLQFQISGYDSEADQVFQKQQNGGQSGSNKLARCAVEKSSSYPALKVGLGHGIRGEQELQAIERQLISRQTNDLLTLRGSSTNPAVAIGSSLTFGEGEDVLPGISGMDRFSVMQVSHHILADGSYQNSFLAVPADHPFPLNMPNVAAPVCGPLVAEVVENADPDHLGRVKVRFPMDLEKTVSPWMKVLTPFTGHNGFFFLPETGEKVLVFFEDFHPEKSPFVLGSFFHGGAKATAWSDSKNRKKGWQTEKASILFDDNTGKLTIKATSISLEAGTQLSVTTEANGKMCLESPDISLAASNKMELSGGTHLKQQAARIDIN